MTEGRSAAIDDKTARQEQFIGNNTFVCLRLRESPSSFWHHPGEAGPALHTIVREPGIELRAKGCSRVFEQGTLWDGSDETSGAASEEKRSHRIQPQGLLRDRPLVPGGPVYAYLVDDGHPVVYRAQEKGWAFHDVHKFIAWLARTTP